MELELTTLLMLVGAAFVAGFVDSIAGGGGLISLPALLLAGLPPVEAVATNKLQATFGSTTAAYRYWKAGLVDSSQLKLPFIAALVGGAVGAACLGLIDPSILSRVMPVMLVAVALYFALAPSASDVGTKAHLGQVGFAIGIAAPIGFYDGMFGPGTGSFFTAGLVALAGFGLLQAIAHTKILNTGSNVASLAMFVALGQVYFHIGLPMAVGQTLGAIAGSKLAMKHGARLIRPLIVVMTILVALRLLMR